MQSPESDKVTKPPIHQTLFKFKPQCPQLSSAELPQQDDDKDNTNNKSIRESQMPNTQLYSGLNPCTDKKHGNKGSEHNKGGSPSGCFDEYFADIMVVDSRDSGHLANLSLKQSDNVLPSSKKSVSYNKVDISKDVIMAVGASPDMLEQGEEDCQAKFSSNLKPVETDGKNGGSDMPISSALDHASDEQQNGHSETENAGAGHKVESNSTSQLLQESMQLAKEYEDCSETTGAVSSEQNMMLYDAKASQRQFGLRSRCLQFEEAQQNNMANSPGSSNQSNSASNSKSPTSPVDSEVLETSCADRAPTPSTTQLENRKRPIFSTFPTQNYGNSSLTVSKPSGIGLHLNSIVNAMPMQGSSASITSAEGGYLNLRGKKSLCIASCHLTESARSFSTSSNVVEDFSVITEENQYKSHISTIASSGNPSLHSLKPLYDPVLSKNPIEHHATPGDKREPITEHPDHVKAFTRSSPRKKRKKTLGSNDGDGCKRCNCKKSKCLKLYCDCFAAGIYCADPCSCQGCFNRPEYEDTVLETRQQIESRNPLAFAPKVVQHVIELAADSTQEVINHSTPSSARHKRGCNCKKSICLKKYCECYQSNVGCSDGCRCEGCKNVFGRKDEYVFSKDNISKEATNEKSEISFDEKLEKVATRNDFMQAEICRPHNLTPLRPLFQCSDRGKDALKSWSPSERYLPSQESDLTFFAPHGKPTGSPINSDNHDMIQDTSKYILDVISFDKELRYGNSERLNDFSPHGLGNIDTLSAQQNSPSIMAMTSLLSAKTTDWTTSSQFCPGSGPFSSVSSLRWQRSSPIIPTILSGETKLPQVFDSDNELYNIMEDDDTPEILKDNPTPITAVKVSSPNKKRVSPPYSRLHKLDSSSSAGLRSGRKFILKSIPSFPPLTPCIDIKGTTIQITNDHPDCSNSK